MSKKANPHLWHEHLSSTTRSPWGDKPCLCFPINSWVSREATRTISLERVRPSWHEGMPIFWGIILPEAQSRKGKGGQCSQIWVLPRWLVGTARAPAAAALLRTKSWHWPGWHWALIPHCGSIPGPKESGRDHRWMAGAASPEPLPSLKARSSQRGCWSSSHRRWRKNRAGLGN